MASSANKLEPEVPFKPATPFQISVASRLKNPPWMHLQLVPTPANPRYEEGWDPGLIEVALT